MNRYRVRRPDTRFIVVSALIAGVPAGLSAQFLWVGLLSMPFNICDRPLGSCPDRGLTIFLGILLGIVGLIGLVIAGWIAVGVQSWPHRVLTIALFAVSLTVSLSQGGKLAEWIRGPVALVAWRAPHDRPAPNETRGVWVLGEAVVRARIDGLVAYAPGDGRELWRVTAPGRQSVCAMSDTTSDGVGLVGFGRQDKPCATVWAVDLRAGRTLWKRSGPPAAGAHATGRLAVDGDVAVSVNDKTVNTFGLRDGKPRWSASPGDDRCAPTLAAAAGGHTRILLECSSADAHGTQVVTLATATGAEEGRQTLPVESRVAMATVVSSDPFTLRLKEEDKRGTDALLAFGDPKDKPVVVPMASDSEDLEPDDRYENTDPRPALLAAISDNTLVVASREPGHFSAESLSAFSLVTGRRVWHRRIDGDPVALAPSGAHRVSVLTHTERLVTLDSRTGHDAAGPVFAPLARKDTFYGPRLVPLPNDRWVLVGGDDRTDSPVLGLK